MGNFDITDKLAESGSSTVSRGYRIENGEPVVLKILKKDTATKDELDAFKREFEIASKLNLPGVVKVLGLEEHPGDLMMVMADIGGRSLDRILENDSLPLSQFLELAVAFAETLGSIHRQRIIHRNINPSNIIWNPGTQQFNLIDFGIADELPEQRVAPLPPSFLEGTLAYLSPEQTGRMNRPVDYRTDFYSLGVTFYRMLTGRLPFETEDALGMVHSHIARTPPPPHELNADIPEMVSRIVMKLMSKMADDRYQSAFGLKADLEKCRRGVKSEGAVRKFELGLEDFSEQLRFPQKLYGRKKETGQLLKAFERAASGGRELVFIAGYAGIGKTSLVYGIHQSVREKRGCFIEGKFDQLQRNIPYVAWIQALGRLVDYLLMDSEAGLSRWKDNILSAVGGAGGVLTDVIPNLELVIGPQPAVSELGGIEAQNRFNHVFIGFIKAIATGGHPLVVFLDDLQWVDAASLTLLQALANSTDLSNILMIGAYRDNEVDTLHPLARSIEAFRKSDVNIDLMTLGDISEKTINELIANTLHCEQTKAATLTHLIYAKTGGNPFFLLHTLRSLVENKAIRFDVKLGCWKWDMPRLKEMEITDNVVDLMLGKILQLPDETRNLLALAACIGFRFDPADLGVISEQPEDSAVDGLWAALQEGVISALDSGFQFVHDRIQQAAYSLIPDAEKQQAHLRIGRLLLGCEPGIDFEKQCFAIADHFNIASELLIDPNERIDVARLNLHAGSKARASAAFSAAAGYLNAGVSLLTSENWETAYELALELCTRAAEASSLVGDFTQTERLFETIVSRARRPVDMVGAYMSRMTAFSAQGRLPAFIECAIGILDRLGIRINPHPTEADIQNAMAGVRSMYDPKNIQALIDLPENRDPVEMNIMRVLDLAQNSAYSGRPDLFVLFVLEGVKRAIIQGVTAESMHSFCHMGLLLCGLPSGDIDEGFQFGMLASTLAEKKETSPVAPNVMGTTVGMMWAYKRHLRDTIDTLEPLYHRLKETGDFEYAGYVLCWRDSNKLLAGGELVELEKEMCEHFEYMKSLRAEVALRWHPPFWQAVRNLLGRSECPWVIDGEVYDRPEMLRAIEETGNLAAQTALHVNTLTLCYLFGRYDEALVASSMTEKIRSGMVAMPIEPVWYFYDSLTRLALCTDVSESEKQDFLAKAAENQAYLKMRADHAPMNYLHKWHLVEAEKMRVLGDGMSAIENYDSAVSLARENGYIQEEALANELAAGFWIDKGKEDFARLYMTKAYRCYNSWGAKSKVKDLEERYSSLIETKPTEAKVGTTRESLDLSSIMKAARTISGEIKLDKLLDKVLHIVIENAGAQSGFLLLERDGIWQIIAKGGTSAADVDMPLPVGMDESDVVARSVVHFVTRTKERIVLDDASNRGEFMSDPFIKRKKTKSLLCAPLLSLGRLIGILYLENNLTAQAFTPERVQILEMLLLQTAISLESARIFEALRKNEALLNATQELAKVGGWEFDVKSGKSFWTDGLYRIHEIPHNPDIDHLVESPKCYRPEDRSVLLNAFHKACEKGEPYDLEFPFTTFKGNELWVRTIAQPVYEEGKVVRLIGNVMDITERKRAEAEVERLKNHLANIIDSMPSMLVGMDNNEIVTQWNRQVEAATGIPAAEALGRPIQQMFPYLSPHIEAMVGEVKQRHPAVMEKLPVEGKGERRLYDLILFPLISNGTEGAVLRIEDVTERTRIQEMMIQTEKMMSLGGLAAGMAHEINNPLGIIGQAAQNIERRVSPEIQANLAAAGELGIDIAGMKAYFEKRGIHDFIGSIREATLRASRIIQNILRFSCGTEDILKPTSLVAVLDQALELAASDYDLKKKYDFKSIAIIRDDTPDIPDVPMVAVEMEQVMLNLLKNAAQAMAENPPERKPRITIHFRHEDRYVLMEMADNGPGMTEEVRRRVFEPFFTTKEPGVGTGLGLSVAYMIVTQNHKGLMEVESTPDMGACFKIRLPCAKENM